ncbi:MAG: ABC transporter ATP-binding protein [Deltaproteobacteria bacterium]|nr:MAG: ABC transporter ATP-binding protein [Deltaproteobacteria bacterium]
MAKRFGPVTALRDLDLDVERGSVLAVLGPNGAGKSTLLGLVAGLMRPTAGSLRVNGQEPRARTTRAAVGFIGHATFLYPDLTARENLRFAARLFGVPNPEARVEALLEDYDLARYGQRRAGTFSQGMAHRLSIARGLVHDPDIVLLDEPFAGLDRTAAARLGTRLREVRGGGRTVVLVTHDLARAAELADAAIVLSGGACVHHTGRGEFSPAALERAYLAAVDGAT